MDVLVIRLYLSRKTRNIPTFFVSTSSSRSASRLTYYIFSIFFSSSIHVGYNV